MQEPAISSRSRLQEGNDLTTVMAGQTLITDSESGIGLEWGTGGSLRIDQDTRIDFVSRDSVYLRSGRVYFDSTSSLAAAGPVAGSGTKLTITTDFGVVQHIGTQFMAAANRDRLIVSVREGEIVVESAGRNTPAVEGQQLAISGSGAFDVVNIKSYDGAWTWVEQTAPGASLDGRTVSEFLDWVSRETGLQLDYRSPQARSRAEQSRLNGQLQVPPRQALEVWMLGTDLPWRIDNGVIYVGENE